jgi:serine/threonine-protein kinase RsbW
MDQRRRTALMAGTQHSRILELDYPAEPRIVHDLRELFEVFVQTCNISRDDVEAIKVALSEACSNAVCHGSPVGGRNRIRVRCEVDEEQMAVEVRDEGRGFQLPQIALPHFEEWKPSGRGLFLMYALMDEVAFEPTSSGTHVRLVKYLRERPGEGLAEPGPPRNDAQGVRRPRLAPIVSPRAA